MPPERHTAFIVAAAGWKMPLTRPAVSTLAGFVNAADILIVVIGSLLGPEAPGRSASDNKGAAQPVRVSDHSAGSARTLTTVFSVASSTVKR